MLLSKVHRNGLFFTAFFDNDVCYIFRERYVTVTTLKSRKGNSLLSSRCFINGFIDFPIKGKLLQLPRFLFIIMREKTSLKIQRKVLPIAAGGVVGEPSPLSGFI